MPPLIWLSSASGTWFGADFIRAGVRVSGTAVPEPAPLTLLSLGLLAVGLYRRKQDS